MLARKLKILIVDDEPVVCELLYDGLQEKGYLCLTARNGSEALEKLNTEDFALMLLDIRLPDISGMEVLRETCLNHSKTKTIMITAVNDAATAVEAMKLGASDYIVKPFDLDRVDTSIRDALETRQRAEGFSTEIEAIARGVELTLDSFSTYSRLVTTRTIKIAYQLGIAQGEIEQWVSAKAMLDAKKDRVIKLVN